MVGAFLPWYAGRRAFADSEQQSQHPPRAAKRNIRWERGMPVEKPFSYEEYREIEELGISLFGSPDNMDYGARIIRMCKDYRRLKKLAGEEMPEVTLEAWVGRKSQ